MITYFTKDDATALIGKKVKHPIDNDIGKVIAIEVAHYLRSDGTLEYHWQLLVQWDNYFSPLSYNKQHFSEFYSQ